MALPQPSFEWRAVAPARPRARWPGLVGAVLALATIPPVIIAAIRVPAGSVFSGYVVIARDAYVYQAIWRQGWHGAWLFRSPYTSENLPNILLYPWYLWPAHLVGWAEGPWLYHISRLGAAAALIVAVWLLVRELFRPSLLRRWAFVFAVLGGGVGVLLPRDVHVGPFITHATEISSPGTSVADLISMAPHLPWSIALMCWAMVVALRLRHRGRVSELISGLAAVVGLQLIYPQLAILTVLVVAGWALLRRQPRPLRYALAAGALQAPYLGYLFYLSRDAPDALAVIRPSLDVGDPFGFLVLSHFVATGLIVYAIWRGRLRGDLWLPALWIAGMTLFMFLPGISRTLGRSFMASSVPFGLCAAPGLLSLLRGIRSRPWRRRIGAAALAASSLYGVFSLAQPYWIAAFRLDPRAEYEPAAEAALLQRLAPRVTSRDVVLTTYLDGIFVPIQTDARAFVGHPEMTIDAGRKADQALAFFGSWSAAQRRDFVRAKGIDYVLADNADAVGRLQNDADFKLIDQQGSMALFEVRP
jgi:hypothetical protein